MKQPLLTIVAFLFFSNHLTSMQAQSLSGENILYFNIGGYKMDISRSTIEQFGGDYLKAFISGKFGINRDRDGRAFIDRPEGEGKVISSLHSNSESSI